MKQPAKPARVERLKEGLVKEQPCSHWAVVLPGCLLLAGAVFAVYWPALRYPFTNFDDLGYILLNMHVRAGLSWETLTWAFSTGYAANWHPLTWLSHALDCQLFGLNPLGHHLTGLLVHICNTLLVFFLLRNLTGAAGRSALVAALFGLHPMHVESVAWVAERKDVLSGFFFLATVWSYASYARARVGARKRRLWYIATLGLFMLALMSKPMAVTLPFVLLLLDCWPLKRFQTNLEKTAASTSQSAAARPVFPSFALPRLPLADKLPFMALSAAACVVTFLAQRQGGAVVALDNIPFGLRLSNAAVSYVAYAQKMCWPTRLAIYYPHPVRIPAGEVLGAALLLLAVSALALALLRTRPWVAVGWFWYLGMLVPVIGLVQVGLQAMADRYTYLPSLGFFIAVVWVVGDWCASWRFGRWLQAALAAGALAACVLLAIPQVQFWKDSETLCRHALAVTPDNAIVRGNLGSALAAQRRFAEAADEFSESLRLMPLNAEVEVNFGFALAAQGRFDEAIAHYHRALELRSASDRTHYVLSQALLALGRRDEAVAELRATLRLNPNYFMALNDLAWMLATDADAKMRDGAQAVELAERACRFVGSQEPQFVGTLAAAYAEAGRFEAAVQTAEKAERLAAAAGREDLAKRNAQLLELYRAGKPCRETN